MPCAPDVLDNGQRAEREVLRPRVVQLLHEVRQRAQDRLQRRRHLRCAAQLAPRLRWLLRPPRRGLQLREVGGGPRLPRYLAMGDKLFACRPPPPVCFIWRLTAEIYRGRMKMTLPPTPAAKPTRPCQCSASGTRRLRGTLHERGIFHGGARSCGCIGAALPLSGCETLDPCPGSR
jgi:hypothetical protein